MQDARSDDWDAPPLAELAEALGLGMAYRVVISADGAERRFTHLSDNCEALTGVSPETALADGRALYDLILPEDREDVLRAEAAAIAGDLRFMVEVRMLGADGDLRWRRMASCGRQLPDGSTQWDGLLTDVTTSRRTAEELEAQRSRLEIAVEATELGFWEWDPKADTLNWSDRLKALFGFPIDRPVTIEQYLGAIHPDDLERCLAMYRQARDRPGGGDFSMEYRITARSGHQHWILTRGRVLSDEHGPYLVVGTTVDVTERRAADERRALVVSELAHRVKNGLGVMMAIITETSRSAETVEDFKEVLISRLEAMAQAQDLVTASGGRPVLLADLAERTLAPFGLTRFDLENEVEGITVQGEVTAGLALLLHEMATNAVKYGALSTPEGRVALTAEEAGPGMAALHWRERGGPRVTPSERRGFGSKLLQAALRQQGGKVEPRFDPDGFRARMEFRVAS